MKRLLYWTTAPFSFVIFALASLLGAMCEGCTETCHMWEGWCLDPKQGEGLSVAKNYKTKYKGMYYKGDGIWSSFKEEL